MPLKKGKTKKVHGQNVGELLAIYKETGKIGTTTPRNLTHATEIANAIAYDKAKGKPKGRRKR